MVDKSKTVGDGRALPTAISMAHVYSRTLPPGEVDIRLSEALVETIVRRFTSPGDIGFDPFAGFGTVLLVAERLGRHPHGIEIDESRAEFARLGLTKPDQLILGDARNLAALPIPRANLSLSSPPFMCHGDLEDPLTGYSQPGAGYERYLDQLSHIYFAVADKLTASGHLVIEVANLKKGDKVTTLAWDLAARLRRRLHFLGETIVTWDRYGYGYDHSYCLAFRTPPEPPLQAAG